MRSVTAAPRKSVPTTGVAQSLASLLRALLVI